MPEAIDVENDEPVPHSVPVSIFLHLVPGAAMTLSHVAIIGYVVSAGLPSIVSWAVLVNVFVFYPIMFGILFFVARRRGNKGFSLEGVVTYRATLAIWKQLGWTLVVLVATGLIFLLLAPVTEWMQTFFEWMPPTDEGYDGDFPTSVIAITFALNVVFTGIATPISEELYYRGYLLPRMPVAFGTAGPVVHSFLFAVHHFHSPWMIVTRTIGLLPMIYVTRYTKSLVPAVISHSLVNIYSMFEGAAARWGDEQA